MTKVYDAVAVGSANTDLVVGVERRPAAGQTVLGSGLAAHPEGWCTALLRCGPRPLVVTLMDGSPNRRSNSAHDMPALMPAGSSFGPTITKSLYMTG